MEAMFLKPTRDFNEIGQSDFRELIFGNSKKALFHLENAQYNRIGVIERPGEFKDEHAFLEACFEYTALSEEWKNKGLPCVSVGDVLIIQGGGTWFCANMGWDKLN